MSLFLFFQKTSLLLFFSILFHSTQLQTACVEKPKDLPDLIVPISSGHIKVDRASLQKIPFLPKNQFQIIAKLQTIPNATLFISRYRQSNAEPYEYKASLHTDESTIFLPHNTDKKELFMILKKALCE